MGRIVVVGGGISGLVCAHALRQAGREVLLLEQARRAGGCIASERIGGFLMEHGPNTMVAPAPAAESLIDALGLAAARVERGEAVRRRYLVRDGRARPLPLAPHRFFASDFFTLRGRLRMLLEPLMPRGGEEDEFVADFTHRRFGREFLDYVMNPLVGGLYAGDPGRLSVAAVFPQLKELERRHGSVIKGLLHARRRRGSAMATHPANRMLFSFRHGLETLPRTLAQALGRRIAYGCRVEAIHPGAGGYRVRVRNGDEIRDFAADAVVLALPAHAAARIVAPLDDRAGTVLADIPHPPLAVVFLGYRRADIAHPLDGLGVLVPTIERRRVLGILFSSTLFADRAPEDHVALTVFVGGARQPGVAHLPEDDLVSLARDEVRALLGARADPVMARVRHWPRSLPQPAPGHNGRILSLQDFEAQYPGLFLTGNYLSGVSTAACIAQAAQVARRALERPNRRRTEKCGVAA